MRKETRVMLNEFSLEHREVVLLRQMQLGRDQMKALMREMIALENDLESFRREMRN